MAARQHVDLAPVARRRRLDQRLDDRRDRGAPAVLEPAFVVRGRGVDHRDVGEFGMAAPDRLHVAADVLAARFRQSG